MGVSELTNDLGARNNSREHANGALHELDVSTNSSKRLLRLKRAAIATQKGWLDYRGGEAYIYRAPSERWKGTTAQS